MPWELIMPEEKLKIHRKISINVVTWRSNQESWRHLQLLKLPWKPSYLLHKKFSTSDKLRKLWSAHDYEEEISKENCPVGWGRRIHRLLLCRGVRPPSNECPIYDTKQSDGEVLAMLELWRMRSNPLLPLLPGPLWPGVVVPDKGPIYK